MKWLTLRDLELIHMQILDDFKGTTGIRDPGRLESALAGMQQETFGQELYVTVYEKAGVLCRGIIADHPFIDGNKRTAMVASLVFLNLNGVDTSALEDQDLEDFAVQIAVEHCSVADIAAWFERNSCT